MFVWLQGAQALTYDELQGLTYLQVKGSGIANTCPVLEGGSSNLKDLKPGAYQISKFCLEPTSFTVKEESQFKTGEPEFVKTKLMTRLTYTLDEVRCHAGLCRLLLRPAGSSMHSACSTCTDACRMQPPAHSLLSWLFDPLSIHACMQQRPRLCAVDPCMYQEPIAA